MKSKLKMRTPAVVLTLIAALTTVTAVVARAADNKNVLNPVTGLLAPPTINPIRTPLPNWKDPDKVLPEVSFDGLPLDEVAKLLREWFKDAFDVLILTEWRDPGAERSISPQITLIHMKLKNVTASEVFNAMNLVFETENTPLRWELTMNGKRPTAVLRVLPALLPPAVEREPQQRMIYFVGELLGDEKSGGVTMEQLVKTISEVYDMSYGMSQSHLQFHKQAQLLIATGTVDQIRFVEQTIAALGRRRNWSGTPAARSGGNGHIGGPVPDVLPKAGAGAKAGESKVKAEETKAP